MKPMLAKQFNKVNPVFPYIGQPKLNGFRCTSRIETIDVGTGLFKTQMQTVVLRTREGLRIHLPHISDQIMTLYSTYGNQILDFGFDGELYIHGEKLNNIKRRIPIELLNGTITTPSLPVEDINYHCYDIIDKHKQNIRIKELQALSDICDFIPTIPNIRFVESIWVKDTNSAYEIRDLYIKNGYEGLMLRDPNGYYQEKRCNELLKLKKTQLSKHYIIDIIDEGETNNMYTIKFLLRNDINKEVFECIPGSTDDIWDNNRKRHLVQNKNLYVGNIAIVSSYDRSGVKKVPFHGNVISIVDSNDNPLS